MKRWQESFMDELTPLIQRYACEHGVISVGIVVPCKCNLPECDGKILLSAKFPIADMPSGRAQ